MVQWISRDTEELKDCDWRTGNERNLSKLEAYLEYIFIATLEIYSLYAKLYTEVYFVFSLF